MPKTSAPPPVGKKGARAVTLYVTEHQRDVLRIRAAAAGERSLTRFVVDRLGLDDPNLIELANEAQPERRAA